MALVTGVLRLHRDDCSRCSRFSDCTDDNQRCKLLISNLGDEVVDLDRTIGMINSQLVPSGTRHCSSFAERKYSIIGIHEEMGTATSQRSALGCEVDHRNRGDAGGQFSHVLRLHFTMVRWFVCVEDTGSTPSPNTNSSCVSPSPPLFSSISRPTCCEPRCQTLCSEGSVSHEGP